jgi:hypothetical protein
MRAFRRAFVFALLASLSLFWTSPGRTAYQPDTSGPGELLVPALVADYHFAESAESAFAESSNDDKTGGIKEDIPVKYAARYSAWKKEFLSTESGRQQWELYQNNPNLTLTITVARDNSEGATTGKYKWNDAGQLSAATIALGFRLNEGYPNPIYFPVMNSLVPTGTSNRIAGDTLAATKLAHEFGHVNRTARVDPALYQLQAQLIPQYNKIFLTNGRNPNDAKLIELVQQLGGTPVEIWEDREYWGEANAMIYLRDRFTDEGTRCPLFSRIRHSVDLYAKSYEPRFLEVARASSSRKVCGWP